MVGGNLSCQLVLILAVPQHAWAASGTIRDNITLGQSSGEVDFERLGEVVKACGLDEDLAHWEAGILLALCPVR